MYIIGVGFLFGIGLFLARNLIGFVDVLTVKVLTKFTERIENIPSSNKKPGIDIKKGTGYSVRFKIGF